MYNYPNNYNNAYYMKNLQDMREQIDKQMAQAQQNMAMQPQQPQINQTFQLSNPQQSMTDFDCRYVDNINDVRDMLVLRNSIFVNRDMSNMWLKDVNGNIKGYALSEIVEKDDKDMQIEDLRQQLSEIKAIMLSSLNKQNEAFLYSNQQVIPQNNKNGSIELLEANMDVQNNNVVKRNKGDVKNEQQRNNKYVDEQSKANKS